MIAEKIRSLTDKEAGLLVWDKQKEEVPAGSFGRYCDIAQKRNRMG